MFYQSRDDTRKIFFAVWEKMQSGGTQPPMQPLELQIASVIAQHPEYHEILAQPQRFRDQDYLPEAGQTNPFLHMGMHIAINDQISTNQPPGISALVQSLASSTNNMHTAEHRMMDCLAQMIWTAQKEQQQPDFLAYLACVTEIIK